MVGFRYSGPEGGPIFAGEGPKAPVTGTSPGRHEHGAVRFPA